MNSTRRFCAKAGLIVCLVGRWSLIAAQGSSAQGGATANRPSELIGHWRKTIIAGGEPIDDNLVLAADGRAANWTVTARRRDQPKQGVWGVEGRTLIVRIQGEQDRAMPYTLHEGSLVYPNIPNQRRFWERVR